MTVRPASSDGGVDGHPLEVRCDAIGLVRPFRHGRRSSPFDDLSSPPWHAFDGGRCLEAGGLRIALWPAPEVCPASSLWINATALSAAPFRQAPLPNAGHRCGADVKDQFWGCIHWGCLSGLPEGEVPASADLSCCPAGLTRLPARPSSDWSAVVDRRPDGSRPLTRRKAAMSAALANRPFGQRRS